MQALFFCFNHKDLSDFILTVQRLKQKPPCQKPTCPILNPPLPHCHKGHQQNNPLSPTSVKRSYNIKATSKPAYYTHLAVFHLPICILLSHCTLNLNNCALIYLVRHCAMFTSTSIHIYHYMFSFGLKMQYVA